MVCTDFANTQVKTLIRERVKCTTQRGRILFTCPPLNEFFPTSTFKLDLARGCIYTFLTQPEDIGIPCQQEEFDLELLARKFQNDPENSEMCVEELERILRIRKEAAPADCMDLVRGRKQILTIHAIVDPVCRNLNRT